MGETHVSADDVGQVGGPLHSESLMVALDELGYWQRQTHFCVRADGIVYTSYGYSDRKATRYSVADQADCQDLGEDAAGSVFPEDPEQVTTWAFRGYPTDRVVGVRFDRDSFAVFVSDSVSDTERDRIYRDLRGD